MNAAAVISPEEVLKQLQWRYATKEFDLTKKIPEEVWNVLEQSLVLSPSSFGVQPWKFIVVRNPEIRHQLVEHSWGQKPVEEASHLVVFAIKKDIDTEYVDSYIKRMSDVRDQSVEGLQGLANMIKGFIDKPPYPLDVNAWSTRQVYIALGFYMTCAAMLGIDTLPMEGFVPDKYDQILGLEEKGYHAVVVCAAGYRSSNDKYIHLSKVRFKTEDIIDYVD